MNGAVCRRGDVVSDSCPPNQQRQSWTGCPFIAFTYHCTSGRFLYDSFITFFKLNSSSKSGSSKTSNNLYILAHKVTCAHHYAALRGHTDIWFHFSQRWSHFSEKWAINKSKWNRWKVKVLIKRHLRIVNGQIAHVNLYKLKAALPTSAPSHHSCVTHERGNTCCLHV